MNQVAFVTNENKKLRALNKQVVKKRQKRKSYILNEDVLSVAEAWES